MKTLALFALLLSPAQALASCESIISVHSSTFGFCTDAVWPPPAERAVHLRSLAHALATAQACFDSARAFPDGARLVLTQRGELQPVFSVDWPSRIVAMKCARADWDSSCVVWTCELGRFASESRARECASGARPYYVPECSVPGDLRGSDARVLYSCCAGAWAPASFVVPIRRDATWAARAGFYFTRADAEHMAETWARVTARPVRIVRQRVDGSLLEQVLKAPDDPL